MRTRLENLIDEMLEGHILLDEALCVLLGAGIEPADHAPLPRSRCARHREAAREDPGVPARQFPKRRAA